MGSVEIIVGQRWQDDIRYLNDLRSYRAFDAPLDLIEIRDIIDIVVDGTNLTSSIAEESIFGIIGELVEGLSDLAAGHSYKAIIEFHCEPWELVLVPDGRHLLVSLYSVDREHRVIAHSIAIDAEKFIQAVTSAGEAMLTDLIRISEKFSADSFVRQFSARLGRLKRQKSLTMLDRPKGDVEAVGSRVGSTSVPSGLTLSYQFDGDDRYLRQYCGTHAFDLHALLFRGRVEAEFDGNTVLLSERHPFLVAWSLVSRVRELLNLLETSDGDGFICHAPLFHGRYDVTAESERWQLTVGGGPKDKPPIALPISPSECIDAALTLAELLVKDLLSLNPHLELNQRLVDLDEELNGLRGWHQDITGNNLYLDTPEEYLEKLGHLRPLALPDPPTASFSWPFETLRTLFPRLAWTFTAEHIDFETITRAADRVLVGTNQAVHCLNPAHGEDTWRYDFYNGQMPASFAVTPDLVVISEHDRGIALVDRNDGRVRAMNREVQSWSQLLGATQYASENLVIVTDLQWRVTALSTENAHTVWQHVPGTGRFAGVAFPGPVVSTLSTEGLLTTLNPTSGEILWKVRLGGPAESPPTVHQGRLYTFTHDAHHRSLNIQSFQVFTGRTAWQIRAEGVLAGPPSFADNWLMVPVERHGQIFLEGIDIEASHPGRQWQIELSSAGLYQPTPVCEVEIDGVPHGLIKTDRAELTCFRICDGELRWRVVPEEEVLLLQGNLPVIPVRDGVVTTGDNIDFRVLDSGRLVHTFQPIDTPEYVEIGGELSVYVGESGSGSQHEDVLSAYTLEHFLALVADNT